MVGVEAPASVLLVVVEARRQCGVNRPVPIMHINALGESVRRNGVLEYDAHRNAVHHVTGREVHVLWYEQIGDAKGKATFSYMSAFRVAV